MSTMWAGLFRRQAAWLGMILAVMQSAATLSAQSNPAVTTPAGTAPPQPDPLAPLLKQVSDSIDVNSRRYLVANSNSPWQIFHGVLALRQNFLIKVGDQKVSAIEWIATTEPRYDNQPLIVKTEYGANFHPFTRPYAFQGHPAQFLALLTQSNLPTDFKFRCDGQDVTISQMLQDTMMQVNTQEEVTWVLWSLNHYLKSDARWTNKLNEPWSIERLVQTETRAVVENAACGGNHGLFALTRARDKYLRTGSPLRGTWLEADMKIRKYIETARSLQNQDGSFSANFYKGPEFSRDMNERFNTTGHTLEFLAAALPEHRLREPWVQNAVNMLSRELLQYRHQPIDCGPLYHSLNALMIYRSRLEKPPVTSVAVKPAAAKTTETVSPPKLPLPVETPPPEPLPVSLPTVDDAETGPGVLRRLLEGPVSALEPANLR